mgnify:FL=1
MQINPLVTTAAAALAAFQGLRAAPFGTDADVAERMDALRAIRNGPPLLRSPGNSPALVQDHFIAFEDQVDLCLHDPAAPAMPLARRFALCAVEAVVELCEDSADAWCGEALRRQADTLLPAVQRTSDDPAPAGTQRPLSVLLQDIAPRLHGSTVYQDAMQWLVVEFNDRTGLDLARQLPPPTALDLQQVLDDVDSGETGVGARTPIRDAFDGTLQEQGALLADEQRRLAEAHIVGQPERYAVDLLPALDTWLAHFLPRDAGTPLTQAQRSHLLGLLARHLAGHDRQSA